MIISRLTEGMNQGRLGCCATIAKGGGGGMGVSGIAAGEPSTVGDRLTSITVAAALSTKAVGSLWLFADGVDCIGSNLSCCQVSALEPVKCGGRGMLTGTTGI